ncbi:hypothetical protein [Streptomyces purpurogeneiscleroticus]|uniref:hypothetical protein n=1 Tax=Streptomyces purpurogeneiscleroticus TaxID=68259 RepID=UPI001CC001CB|nr:hypothetical protein [Streptomyces purpurogeneiscleroticus]MBZ4014831.1 hypothetical protein [Streptomyces purpurogeneiscleroticus]
MPDGTLWSTDLGPLHIDTDANPGLWEYFYLQVDKKTFKKWLDVFLIELAAIHNIELTRKLRKFHKEFYERTLVTLRDKLQADEAFIYRPVPLTHMPLVMHATRFQCEAPDAAFCEGIAAPTVPHPDIPEWQQRTGSVAFGSPHLGSDGVRVTRSYPADSTIMMTSVTYHWHTPPGVPDVCLRGHHDDPEVIAAAIEPLDDFARTLRLPGMAH